MYRWVEHTSELELEVRAKDDGSVFVDAAAALAELLGDGGGEPVTHDIRLQANDRAGQLVELLEELVFLADSQGFVPVRLAQIDLAGNRAIVEGYKGSPSPLVKAVTYHGLLFRPDGDGWLARVVLDV